MENFRKLKVFDEAHNLVIKTYKLTDAFPSKENFGLISQMRRAAVSVAANIVESTKRKTAKDKNNFHVIADASLEELKYYFLLSKDLRYSDEETTEELLNDARKIGAMLNGLVKAIESRSKF